MNLGNENVVMRLRGEMGKGNVTAAPASPRPGNKQRFNEAGRLGSGLGLGFAPGFGPCRSFWFWAFSPFCIQTYWLDG
jgi:hypothetical protein